MLILSVLIAMFTIPVAMVTGYLNRKYKQGYMARLISGVLFAAAAQFVIIYVFDTYAQLADLYPQTYSYYEGGISSKFFYIAAVIMFAAYAVGSVAALISACGKLSATVSFIIGFSVMAVSSVTVALYAQYRQVNIREVIIPAAGVFFVISVFALACQCFPTKKRHHKVIICICSAGVIAILSFMLTKLFDIGTEVSSTLSSSSFNMMYIFIPVAVCVFIPVAIAVLSVVYCELKRNMGNVHKSGKTDLK